MKLKLTLLATLFLVVVAKADDKRDNKRLVPTECGVNVLETSWVNEVCLSDVRGFESLEVLQTTDTKGNVSASPIVRRTILKKRGGNSLVEVLEVTAGGTEKKGPESYLKTYEATLTTTRKVENAEVIEIRELEGRDGNGRSFKALLEGVVHTQVGGE